MSADNLRIRKNYGEERFVADWQRTMKDEEPGRKFRLLREKDKKSAEKDKKPLKRVNNLSLQNSNSDLFAELAIM